MSLSQLIEVLDRAGVDLDANAILDAIWLARQEPSFDIVHEEGAQNPVQSPVEPDKRMTLPLKRGSQEKTSEPVVEREQGFAMDGAPTLPIFAGVTQGAGRRASAFSTIAASPLFDTLSFQRALRPFRDRVAGRDAEIVDEEATAERSAEVSAGRALRVVPVVVPARERWFQVDLVTEEDPAAEVWREVLAAFAQAMRNSGAFRDVREWKLDLGPAGNGPATLHAPGGAVLPAAALAGERRLILFASHGCSTHWSSGAYAALLYKWARDCAVALIQLLPPDQWGSTALGEEVALVTTHVAGVANAQLGIEPFWWTPPAETTQAMSFPLVDFSPKGVGEWAAMLMARGGPAPATLLTPRPADSPPPPERPAENEAIIQQRVGALLSSAPKAFRLAVLLSDSPFTVPVARLVQEAHFGRSGHEDLARLFVSGLLQLQPGQPRITDSPWFVINPAAAATLRRSLRPADTEAIGRAVLQRVSDHIAKATGNRPSMTSFILSEQGDSVLPDWAKPFALVAQRMMPRPANAPQPAAPQAAREAAARKIEELDPRAQGTLVRLAIANAPLTPESIPPRAWTVLLDRALTWIDGQGDRRLTDAARVVCDEIARARPLLGARILWVDDRRENNASLVRTVTAQGATVRTARTTAEGLRQAQAGVDIIISDMARAEGNREGLALLGGLRDQGIATPVIIFAGRFATSRANRAAAARAGAYYTTNETEGLLRHVHRLFQEPDKPADEVFASHELSEDPHFVEALDVRPYPAASNEQLSSTPARGFAALSNPLSLIGAQLTEFTGKIEPDARRIVAGHLLLTDLATRAANPADSDKSVSVNEPFVETMGHLGWTVASRSRQHALAKSSSDVVSFVFKVLERADASMLLNAVTGLLEFKGSFSAFVEALLGSDIIFEAQDVVRFATIGQANELVQCSLYFFQIGTLHKGDHSFFELPSDGRLACEQVTLEMPLEYGVKFRQTIEAKITPYIESHITPIHPPPK